MDVAYTAIALAAAKQWVLRRLYIIPTDLTLNLLRLISDPAFDLDLLFLCVFFTLLDLHLATCFLDRAAVHI